MYIKNIKMLIKVYITLWKDFVSFSNLLDSQSVGTPIMNEWTGEVLCCHGKKVVLIFLHQKWLSFAVMGKHHSKLLMLFNLAFLIKCKYLMISMHGLFMIRLGLHNQEMNTCTSLSEKWRTYYRYICI